MPVVAVRRLLAVLAVAVAVAVLSAAPAGAQTASTKCTLFAVLKPGNEVPPVDSQATGASLVHIDGTTVRFTTVIANPARETFTLGHIHRGAAGVNGPVVVDFFAGMSTRRLFTQFDTGTLRAPFEDPAEICANPGGFYVNYHTTDDPGGAVRGQLTRLF
jgi:CHRD domain